MHSAIYYNQFSGLVTNNLQQLKFNVIDCQLLVAILLKSLTLSYTQCITLPTIANSSYLCGGPSRGAEGLSE